jgi:hypothetical protein
VQPTGSRVWGGGREASELLIDELSALARALDPVPPEVLAAARAAFAAPAAAQCLGEPDRDHPG